MRSSSTASSIRSRGRRALPGEGSDRAVLDATAQRRRRGGDARRSSSACAMPVARVAPFLAPPPRGSRHWPRNCSSAPIPIVNPVSGAIFLFDYSALIANDARGDVRLVLMAGIRRLPRLPRRAGRPGDTGPGTRRTVGAGGIHHQAGLSDLPEFDRGISRRRLLGLGESSRRTRRGRRLPTRRKRSSVTSGASGPGCPAPARPGRASTPIGIWAHSTD